MAVLHGSANHVLLRNSEEVLHVSSKNLFLYRTISKKLAHWEAYFP